LCVGEIEAANAGQWAELRFESEMVLIPVACASDAGLEGLSTTDRQSRQTEQIQAQSRRSAPVSFGRLTDR
jgi:hypothetical protein